MIQRSPISSILLPSENILSNSMASSNSDSKPEKIKTGKLSPKNNSSQKDQKFKASRDSSNFENQPGMDDISLNEDICFKCRKPGEIYCCQNCFRSFHWKCIGIKKSDQLIKMTHVINFICQSCDTQNACTKCNSIYPKTRFDLIDYSDHNSVLNFYKCTHCYSRIHKKCFDIPFEVLQKSCSDSKDNEIFPHYVCVKCLQNVGITEAIKSQRVVHNLGIEKLYFYVLLNTNSPIHKGWFQEIVLKEHMNKFADNQTFINDFLKDKTLYEYPEIDKIVEMKFPKKYKNTPISEVMKIIEGRTRTPLLERYGNPQNFKFLVKWKQRDYTCLTWEDETIIIKSFSELKRFLVDKQKWSCIMQYINQFNTYKNSINQQVNFKILEYFVTEKNEIKLKYLHLNKEIDPFNRLEFKSFEQRMHTLDAQNAKEPFIQLIEVQFQKKNLKSPYEYMEKLVAYFQKCYLTQIILRPILIITDQVEEWQEAIKNQKRYKEHYVRYTKFYGGKNNTNAIKRWDFFVLGNPYLLKFDILLMDYNYFLYEKQFIFGKIPSFFIVLFDKSQKYSNQTDKLEFIRKNYLPLKSKVQKEIYLVESSSNRTSMEQFASNILGLTELTKNPVKKSVYHTLDFSKCIRFNSSEPKLKLVIEKKYKQSTKIFENSSRQILNEGQRLSFLKFIMSFGLNIRSIEDICTRLKDINPSIWNFEEKDMGKMKELVKQYTSMFVSVISKSSKQINSKFNSASLNYFVFSYQSEMILKRIIQLKKLKTQVEICLDDHSKFPITKAFKFFYSGQCKHFPLWNIYEDYTLGALIVEEGYQRWNQIINSKKWSLYHSQLETRKLFKYDHKTSSFTIQQKIVPKKKSTLQNSNVGENQSVTENLNGEDRRSENGSLNKTQDKESIQDNQITYGEYLINKIKNSKQFKEIEFQRLMDIKIIQEHIAQRCTDIVTLMS